TNRRTHDSNRQRNNRRNRRDDPDYDPEDDDDFLEKTLFIMFQKNTQNFV
ncbi:30236_t:CDS:2, partial [Gigaspora margarita]